PEERVSDPPARKRHQVNESDVETVDRRTRAVVHPEAARADRGDEEEEQDAAHAVVTEPLPHLREEERGEPEGVAEPLLLRDRRLVRAHPGSWNAFRLPFSSS